MKRPKVPAVMSRKNPSGKTIYGIDYFDSREGRRIQRVVGPRKADAAAEAARVYREMMAQFLGEVAPKTFEGTIEQVIDAYLVSKQNRIRPSSIGRYKIYVANFKAFMADNFPSIIDIGDVKKAYIEKFLLELHSQGQVAGTINAELRVLKSIFDFAVLEGNLRENPISRVERFKDERASTEIKFWSEAELKTIFASVNAHWRGVYEFIYLTGLREGELINLSWNDVVLEGDHPKIKIQASGDWVPKTKDRREVPLNRRALEILKSLKKTEGHNYVFTAASGGKIRPKTIYDNLVNPVKRLHKKGLIEFRGSVHSLRHTFASHLVMKGIGIETVSKLLGHSSLEVTMMYAHLAPDHLKRAVDQLSLD